MIKRSTTLLVRQQSPTNIPKAVLTSFRQVLRFIWCDTLEEEGVYGYPLQCTTEINVLSHKLRINGPGDTENRHQ